jgi:hypothetical protein
VTPGNGGAGGVATADAQPMGGRRRMPGQIDENAALRRLNAGLVIANLSAWFYATAAVLHSIS